MKSKMADYDAAAEEEIARWPGAAIVETITGRKHRKTFISFNGNTRFVVSPATTGDGKRGPMRHCNDIRKVLRELGATRQDN